jgi:hypothetical protein
VRHGADEITDVEQGADLARALPAELAKLCPPRHRLDFMRSFLERQVLQYQLSGNETLGRGPLVLLLDKSASMEGTKDIWSTALALALLEHAHAERRPFVLVDFNSRVTYEATVEPGGQLPHLAPHRTSLKGGEDAPHQRVVLVRFPSAPAAPRHPPRARRRDAAFHRETPPHAEPDPAAQPLASRLSTLLRSPGSSARSHES